MTNRKKNKKQITLTVEVSFKADVDPKEILERSEKLANLLLDGALSYRSSTPSPREKELPRAYYAKIHA